MAEEETKKKRKVWVRIVGPKEFKNTELGESYVNDANFLMGKKLKIDLSHLTGDFRRQSVSLGFLITEVSGNQAKAEAILYVVSNAHIRRMIRAGKEKFEYSFVSAIKDNKKVRVKVLVLTKTKTKNSVLTSIRKGTNNYFDELGKISNFYDILNRAIGGELVRNLKGQLKKIYPLSVFEIKSIELMK
ncbi:hypothetical protein HYV88_01830 [Candidatus Woesearchaeota archaeon]|nr:hypothetical protein [Candidatus Woesearchaeota archaeon]